MKIDVTDENIMDGEPYNAERCPVALALRDKGCVSIDVDCKRLVFCHDGVNYMIQTPLEVGIFIEKFDEFMNQDKHSPFGFCELNPFSFQLPMEERNEG